MTISYHPQSYMHTNFLDTELQQRQFHDQYHHNIDNHIQFKNNSIITEEDYFIIGTLSCC